MVSHCMRLLEPFSDDRYYRHWLTFVDEVSQMDQQSGISATVASWTVEEVDFPGSPQPCLLSQAVLSAAATL